MLSAALTPAPTQTGIVLVYLNRCYSLWKAHREHQSRGLCSSEGPVVTWGGAIHTAVKKSRECTTTWREAWGCFCSRFTWAFLSVEPIWQPLMPLPRQPLQSHSPPVWAWPTCGTPATPRGLLGKRPKTLPVARSPSYLHPHAWRWAPGRHY